MHRWNKVRVPPGLLVLFCFLFGANAVSGQVLRTVALYDSGEASEVGFSNYGNPPEIDDSGSVSFFGHLNHPGATVYERAIWSETGDGFAMMAREGDPAPGTGSTFKRLGSVAAAGAGKHFVSASVFSAEPAFDGGIWFHDSGGLELSVRTGDEAVGVPGARILSPSLAFGSNLEEQYSFRATLTGEQITEENDVAVWSYTRGAPTFVVQEGQQAPGTPSGTVFESIGNVTINSLGQTAISASLRGNGVTDANQYGIWAERAGELELIVRSGDEIPGTDGQFTFGGSYFYLVGLNHEGQYAIGAQFINARSGDPEGNGYVVGNADSVLSTVKTGDLAPGTDGATLRVITGPVMNDFGKTAFGGFLGGDDIHNYNNVGLWSDGLDELELVAREGDNAPGTPQGVYFGELYRGRMAINARGQVAFPAVLEGFPSGSSSRSSIWAQDLNGNARLIVAAGDEIEVASGDVRTVAIPFFSSQSGNSGTGSGLNDKGQVAFKASFIDGSAGIFVSNLVAVPEPNALTMLLIVAASAHCFLRKRN